MPDQDRYPQSISRKFKRAVAALSLTPELVGQMLAAQVLRDFKVNLKRLTPTLDRVLASLEHFLSLPADARPFASLGFEQHCANRNEKLLARAALKLVNGAFADATGVTNVEATHALAREYLRQQVDASFCSPVQVRVQQGTLTPNKNFDAVLERAEQQSDALVSERLETWSQCRDPAAIKNINVEGAQQSTRSLLEGNRHDAEPMIGDDDES
jgi:hypothetical protein